MRKFLWAVILPLLLSSCGKNDAGQPAIPPAVEGPGQNITQFTISESRGGVQNWTLEAKNAQILELDKKVLLESPYIKFYEKGKQVSDLKAEKGRINTENNDIWGDGDCLLTTVKGETLTTKNLHYRTDINRIVTDEKVRLVRPDETIDGVGMEATPDLESIKIRKQKVTLNK